MSVFLECILLLFLIFCAVTAVCSRRLLTSVILYMPFSTVLSFIWMLLAAPDLAITEAAVGAGITTVMFFAVMRRTGAMKGVGINE